MAEIARIEKVSQATVARILAANGPSRLPELDPNPPVRRYEHDYPGSVVHFYIKRLARFKHTEAFRPHCFGDWALEFRKKGV